MSATSGIRICFRIAPSFSAASLTGTASRTISQPAASRAQIWSTVASTFRVSVLVIDWTVMGDSPPTWTLPRTRGRVRRRGWSELEDSVMGPSLLEEFTDERQPQDVVADGEHHQQQQQRQPDLLGDLALPQR